MNSLKKNISEIHKTQNFVLYTFFLLFILITSCEETYELSGKNSTNERIYTRLNSNETGIDFSNLLDEDIRYNGLQYEYFYNGGGVAVSDFNNDGLKDIFFVSTLGQHKLFINKGDLKFEDVSDKTGILNRQHFSTGVTVVDINDDGWMDIYLSNSGKFKNPDTRRNRLFVNTGVKNMGGVPIFKEEAKKYGIDSPDCSTQASFFDYDKDGDLDMFLLNHSPSPYPEDKSLLELSTTDGGAANNKLFRNDNGYFNDVTQQTGIIQNRLSYGLGIAIGDVNNDSWPDLYVANDFTGKDQLYINDHNGKFTDRILEATNHISFFSMGNDIADINNDGWMDLMVVDMMGANNYDIKTSMSGMNPDRFYETVNSGQHYQYMYNTLQLNSGFVNKDGTPFFSDIAQITGVSNTDWSWAPLFFDMDNDGLKDLFVSNGIKRDFRNNDFVNFVNKKQDSIRKVEKMDVKKYISDVMDKMPTRKKENYFFKNNGKLEFEKMNETWGNDLQTSSNGSIYADLDNDGDLEIIVNNTDDPAYILKNNSIELGLGHHVKIRLNGPKGNRDGIGTRVVVSNDENKQTQELYFSKGFMSAKDRELHFGLGTNALATIEVFWPDDSYQILQNVKADQLIILDHSKSKKQVLNEKDSNGKSHIFKNIIVEGLEFKHQENDFDDFSRESLLPHRMSNEGPALSIADINQDGLEDIYIGGALGQAGKLFIQNKNASFDKINSTAFEKSAQFEDVSSVFFDADADGDLDLYVVSGGNEYSVGSPNLYDRLYVNDGQGQFTHVENALPNISVSGSCVKPIDFDNDGDLDLFIGGRQVPGKYPYPAKSYLLENKSDSKKIVFTESEVTQSENWQKLGMVTDALWADLNDDEYLDLVIAGEWMPIRVFENENGKQLVEKTADYGLDKTNGWWYSLGASDFDGDGDVDIIAGNLGLNYKYKASGDAPFEVFADDFDISGSNDIVLSYYEEEELVPLRGRECSSNQMPFIKEKFPTYDSFGKAAIEDIFDSEQLKKSLHLKALNFASSYLENKGGEFEVRNLPTEAQLSSINEIVIDDFDNDGVNDVLLAGNLYSSEVETPRNDALHSLYLRGDGQGSFNPQSAGKSGLFTKGSVKEVSPILINKSKNLVFAINNEQIEVVSVKSKK